MTEQELTKARIKIAGFISTRRKELKMLQIDLANKTGLGLATIQRAEDAKFWLGLKQFILILDALESKIDVKENDN
jgi:predicted transcriptional regulator